MKHDYIYNHLNAQEFLIVNRSEQWNEVLRAIEQIDANQFLKSSNDKTRRGELLYNQVAINDEFKRILGEAGWYEMKTDYFVCGDIPTAKEIVKEKDAEKQRKIITERGFEAFSTNNQVDFKKDRIAIEVQFGKYFSVAYDLHVKHTFFFLRDEIDVGIEIIPTHAMMRRMDTGVSWFENEVANVIREGRNNPSVPIVIIGIEPEDLIPETNAASKAVSAKKRVESLTGQLQSAQAKVDKLETKVKEAETKYNQSVLASETAKQNADATGSQKEVEIYERKKLHEEKAQGILEQMRGAYESAKQKRDGINSTIMQAEADAAAAEQEAARAISLKSLVEGYNREK